MAAAAAGWRPRGGGGVRVLGGHKSDGGLARGGGEKIYGLRLGSCGPSDLPFFFLHTLL